MIQFLKDSVREIKHVVWPTRKETQKYFLLVLWILIVFGTYLFLFSNVFSTIVFGIKDAVSGGQSAVSTEAVNTDFLDDITSSGSEVSGSWSVESEIISDEASTEPEAQ